MFLFVQLIEQFTSKFNCTAPWLLKDTRKLFGDKFQICKEESSKEAAAFYFHNRYASHQECYSACTSMTITTNLKYNVKDKSLAGGQIILFFPREIQVIRETLMKTVPNFGKIKSIAVKNLLTFSLCSRGGWGLSWYDPGLQHARSSILSHQN